MTQSLPEPTLTINTTHLTPHPQSSESILAHVSRYRLIFRVSVLTYHNPANNPINGITDKKFPRMLLAGLGNVKLRISLKPAASTTLHDPAVQLTEGRIGSPPS